MFVEAVEDHYRALLSSSIHAGDVAVRVTLANGQLFQCRGLSVRQMMDKPGVIVLHGSPNPDEAIIVRDDHIVAVNLSLRPPDDPIERPFGFAARRSST